MSVRRGLAMVTVFVVVAAACGDRSDNESAAVSSTTETSQPGGGVGDFGDLAGVCGPVEGEPTPPSDDNAESQGIDSGSISVGTMADPGFEGRPGLNQEIFDAAEAFAAWCNEAGGINGRTIDLTLYDAAINQYQPRLEEACGNEFAMVGSGAVQDNLWIPIGPDCGLIDIPSFSVTPEKGGAANDDVSVSRTVQPLPNPSDRVLVGGAELLAEEFPEAGDRTGMLFGDLQTLATQKEKEQQGFESVGQTIVHESAYNILGEANWSPFAAGIKDDEVSFLRFVGEGSNLALLQQALEEQGYRPDVILNAANIYDQSYVDAAGDSAEGSFIEASFAPFEEADDNPATQLYLDIVEAQGGKTALLGAQAVSAWLLFATAAGDCDREGDLTRSCVLDKAASTTDWTGGGLHGPSSPATNEGTECVLLLRVEDGGFVRHAPDEGFFCDPANLAEVSPTS